MNIDLGSLALGVGVLGIIGTVVYYAWVFYGTSSEKRKMKTLFRHFSDIAIYAKEQEKSDIADNLAKLITSVVDKKTK